MKYHDLVRDYKNWIDEIKEQKAELQELRADIRIAEDAGDIDGVAELAEEFAYLDGEIAESLTELGNAHPRGV